MNRSQTRRVAWLGALAVLAGLPAATALPARAAASCEASYVVANAWPGGFQGGLTVKNLGDTLSTWTVTLTMPAGQSVTQGWGGTWTVGANPTITSPSYAGPLATNGSVSLGFLGSGSGTGSPGSVTLNGTACRLAGGVTTTTTTTTSPTTTTTTAGSTTTTTTPTTTTTTTTTTTSTSSTTTTTTTTTGSTTTGCPAGQTYGNPLPSSSLAATRIQGGFAFTEGPVWVAGTGTLLFSELQPASGTEGVQPSAIRTFRPPSQFGTLVAASGSNGLAITRDGSAVLAATHDQRAVSSFTLPGLQRSTVASTYLGKRFNSPNDLTVRSDGTVYFTDPDFQRGRRADEMSGVTGVYGVRDGVVTRLDATVREPNGIVLSPDEKTLYVGANSENRIYRYVVNEDGSVRDRTTFATMSGPDGVTIDCAGNIYWASYNDGLIHVFSPAGTQLGTISAGRNTTNAAFGGSDRTTLYITSGTQGDFGLYSVKLAVPGNPY